jgi:hypothetical protein
MPLARIGFSENSFILLVTGAGAQDRGENITIVEVQPKKNDG